MPAWLLGMASRACTGSMPSCARQLIDRRLGPAVEHGILADRQRESPAKLFEGTRVGSMALNWAAPRRRKPRSGRRTRTSAAAIATRQWHRSATASSP